MLSLTEVRLTVFWQEPFSSWTAKGRQDALRGEVERLLAAPPSAAGTSVLARLDGDARSRVKAARLHRSLRHGHGIGRIEIPGIGVDLAVVEASDTASLKRGPGRYPGTDLPGEDGTVAIAGHRTTYGAPFRHIDALKRGDRIEVTMPYGRFRYEVERLTEVTPDRKDVVKDVGRPRLVLSACTPLFSSARGSSSSPGRSPPTERLSGSSGALGPAAGRRTTVPGAQVGANLDQQWKLCQERDKR